MSARTVLSATALAATLCACTVGPDYVRPSAGLPPAFSPVGSTANAADARTWWRSFGDPVLDGLVEKALVSNLDLEAAAARIDQAGAALGLARAALLPRGELGASYTRIYDSVAAPPGAFLQGVPGGYPRNQDDFRLNGSASWELDLFGGNRRRTEAARAEFAATTADAQAARVSLIGTLASSYVALRRIQAERGLTHARVDFQRRDAALSNLLTERGVIAQADNQRIIALLRSDEARLPELVRAETELTNAIDVLLGTPPGTNRPLLLTVVSIPEAASPPDPGAPVDLLRSRPDVIAAEARLRASNAQIGAAISEYYPKFSLSGLLGLASLTGANLFTGSAATARGGVGVSWRIFDFARIDEEIAQARGSNREALARYRASVLVAARDVEDAIARNRASIEILAARTSTLAERDRIRRAARLSFERGATSERDRIIADQAFVGAEIDIATARAERADSVVQLYRALGGGWDAPTPVQVAGRS